MEREGFSADADARPISKHRVDQINVVSPIDVIVIRIINKSGFVASGYFQFFHPAQHTHEVGEKEAVTKSSQFGTLVTFSTQLGSVAPS